MRRQQCQHERTGPAGTWVVAALVLPLALAAALLPLRYHVDDVLVAVVLLAVSAAALAQAEWLPRLVAAASAALSFNFFYAQPYDQLSGGIQGIETTLVLAVAIPVLAAWAGCPARRPRGKRRSASRPNATPLSLPNASSRSSGSPPT
jgi:K+-sensing histidine kinase KdpD